MLWYRVGEEGRRGSRSSSFKGSLLDMQQQQLEESSITSSTHNDEGEETVASSRSIINPGISQVIVPAMSSDCSNAYRYCVNYKLAC